MFAKNLSILMGKKSLNMYMLMDLNFMHGWSNIFRPLPARFILLVYLNK